MDNVRTFLGRVKSVYEMLKLGSLESMPSSADMEDGILPYEVDRISTSPDATMTGHGSALIEIMETLRGAISNLTVAETNVVVYFVYSPNNPGTIVEACVAFQRFFDSYRKALQFRRENPRRTNWYCNWFRRTCYHQRPRWWLRLLRSSSNSVWKRTIGAPSLVARCRRQR